MRLLDRCSRLGSVWWLLVAREPPEALYVCLVLGCMLPPLLLSPPAEAAEAPAAEAPAAVAPAAVAPAAEAPVTAPVDSKPNAQLFLHCKLQTLI